MLLVLFVLLVCLAVFIYRYNVSLKSDLGRSFGIIYAGTDLDSDMLLDGNPILVYASSIEHVASVMGASNIPFSFEGWRSSDHEKFMCVPVVGTLMVKNNQRDEYVELRSKNNTSYLIVPPNSCTFHSGTSTQGIILS